jgi:uncharacterized membrane protein YsdA (DUF1294 family)
VRQRSVPDKILRAFALVFLAAIGTAAYFRQIALWVAGLYGGVSILGLTVYGWDKHRAKKEQWRIAETTLHLLEFCGGWPGALIAQRLFRHKNRKIAFQVVFWLIVLAHLSFWGWVISRRYQSGSH